MSEELLKILVCPVCKAKLDYDKRKNTLTCTRCKEIYPIKEGIPILLPPSLKEE
ncbi:hypothetical protein COT47_00815 [Candidatus Woesearchaeota archaeon CG08_land_8_20_14_0_20_43_7]|nr:MAG: hypothetical protein COT47_00815 [Candidatus Woesearchaeota archaeon CG08_land_8_20_14_0_20_43_7]